VIINLSFRIIFTDDGDIFVSKSAYAADHPECGSSQSPCMTLSYAASRCNNKQCHYKIDGGSHVKPFEYINSGKEFAAHAANFSINGIGLNIPLLSCNSQNGSICITVSGIYFSVNRIKVVGSAVSGKNLPVIYLSSALSGATLSNSIFQDVRLVATVYRLENCSFFRSITRLGAGDKLNMTGCTFADTSMAVGQIPF